PRGLHHPRQPRRPELRVGSQSGHLVRFHDDEADLQIPASMTQLTSEQAQTQLDAHLREIIAWHFSPETGCPFWLEWAGKNFDPRKEIQSIEDVKNFPHFQDEWLRDLQPEVWVPAESKGEPFNIFETGGTTGMQKQSIAWNAF